MIKVLRIINRFNLGGPTFNAAYLTKYMSDNFETLLVGGEIDSSEAESMFIVESLGLKPVIIPEMKREVNFKLDRIAYKKLKRIIREFKPDIIHTHASKAGALGRLAGISCSVKHITHTFHGHVFHSYFGKAKTTFYKSVERYLAKKTSGIVVISEIQKEEICNTFKICPPEKATVIPLGFDLSKFQQNVEEKRRIFRSKWEIEDEHIAIGIIGRLVPIKNHHFFLKVAQQLAKSNENLKFVIIGDGELKQELLCLCNTLNLSVSENSAAKCNVLFTSWIKEVDIANAGLDIICLTSKNEGTPVSLIEAQASGKPIVTTNVGGIENIVIPNKTALLSKKDDLTGFKNNLQKLIENNQLRDEFGRNGNHVMENFHFKRLVRDMEIYYKTLIKN